MFIKGPGIKKMVTNEVVELRDVFPTFYDLAGGDLEKYAFDG
jgi:arylsulfatase A-like enzyme